MARLDTAIHGFLVRLNDHLWLIHISERESYPRLGEGEAARLCLLTGKQDPRGCEVANGLLDCSRLSMTALPHVTDHAQHLECAFDGWMSRRENCCLLGTAEPSIPLVSLQLG